MKYIKYIPWLLLVIALSFVAFYQYRAAETARELLTIRNSELEKANLEIGRANTKIVEQDKLHQTALKEIDKKWKDEIKKREALVTLYAALEAKYEAEKNKVKVITKIVYKDRPLESIDLPHGKIFTKDENGQYKEITSITWSYNDFRITMQGDALKQTLSYKLHQRFKGQLVESKLPTGTYNYYFKLYELDDKNKIVGEIELEKFEVLKAKLLETKMMWWNPKLDLSIGFGIDTKIQYSWSANIGLSLSAYGKTLDDLNWRFFRVGAGIINNHFALSFSPALYNIGKNLPLISNMWLHPYVGYDFGSASTQFGIGLGLVF